VHSPSTSPPLYHSAAGEHSPTGSASVLAFGFCYAARRGAAALAAPGYDSI
jgi:hypothetical protein